MASHDNRSPQLIAISIAFLPFAVLSVAVRVYTRMRMMKRLGADDWFIIAALVGTIALSGVTIQSCYHGLGKHITQLNYEKVIAVVKADLAGSSIYIAAATCVKLSLLSFYLRLSPDQTFRIMTYTLFGICAIAGLACAITVPLQCVPLSRLWGATTRGYCIQLRSFYFANTAIHMVTELMTYLLPIPTLWSLRLPIRQRIGLCFLMSIGAGLIAISCYRLYVLKTLFTSIDITWTTVSLSILCVVELNLAIFITCWPSFLAFYRYCLPHLLGYSTERTRQRDPRSYQMGSSPHVNDSSARRAFGKSQGNKTPVMTRDNFFPSPNNSREEIFTSDDSVRKHIDF